MMTGAVWDRLAWKRIRTRYQIGEECVLEEESARVEGPRARVVAVLLQSLLPLNCLVPSTCEAHTSRQAI